jgi:hypothetical protein
VDGVRATISHREKKQMNDGKKLDGESLFRAKFHEIDD